MSKYKIINFTFFYLALLAAISPHSLSSTSTQTPYSNKLSSEEIFLFRTKVNHQNLLKQQYHNKVLQKSSDKLKKTIVADSELAKNNSNAEESKDKLLKIFFISFLMLFFIPFGIFYPLFLFYRKLLIDPNESNYSYGEARQAKSIENFPSGLNFSQKNHSNTNKATISQLQIAFSPTASDLRRRLMQLSSIDKIQDIVELMRQTTTMLAAQDCSTHVNYSSTILPLEEIRVEFDLVSYGERSKFISKNLSLIGRNSEVDSSQRANKNYSYVVVTLILCTTHDAALFDKIFTREQLVGELIKLSKMRKDRLIKFELLWNPQEENRYISNAQLLTEYDEMIRLL